MKNYLDKFCLKQKVAFVCGGAGLIGAEVSKALASAGANVIVLDVDRSKGSTLQKEMAAHGHDVHFEYFDSTDLKKVERRIAQLAKLYQGLDIWVNTAYPRTKDWADSVEKMAVDSLQKNVHMHLNSYMWISRGVALFMKTNKIKGSIINLGSIYGVQANDFTVYDGTSMTSPMAYAAIKGGIINVTRYLASYFGKDNIRANTICPGGIFDHQAPRFVKNFEHKVPLKRMGTPEDVALAVLFLASDASSYVTGSTLMVDGGWTII